MSGTAITSAPVGATAAVDLAASRDRFSASYVNSFRVAAVAERLAFHVGPSQIDNPTEFFNLCLSLSRGIDYAVANNEVPPVAQELPPVLKQNACKMEWFSDKDREELIAVANELGNDFCGLGDASMGPTQSNLAISNVMTRFYPQMKMGEILASLEVKPGYGAYMIDFHISKGTKFSPHEKIRLFVAQADNLETPTCLITPQKVNFLLNGKGVERRTNIFVDPGPQMPTVVTTVLKYGTNLLQAVGEFSGHYIIVVAYMSVKPLAEIPLIEDYVEPIVAALDSVIDSDIIEGPSRLSLNCPISFKRIQTPVKGHACKHHQCFDFSNFVDINSRRPTWRCPHCNQYVCYPDIRIDRNMAKILKEVGKDVTDVITTGDGSWRAVLESDDGIDHAENNRLDVSSQKEVSEQQDSTVLDLTKDDDDETMDAVGSCDVEDTKPLKTGVHNHSLSSNTSVPTQLNSTIGIPQSVGGHLEDNFWPGVYFPCGSFTLTDRSSIPMVSISEFSAANSLTAPVLSDAISPVHDREATGHGSTNLTPTIMQNQLSTANNLQLQFLNANASNSTTSFLMQNQLSTANNLQLQQLQSFEANISNEYSRVSSIPRHVSRSPIATQALPAQSQFPSSLQRSRTNMMPNGSPLVSQAAPSAASSADGPMRVSSNLSRQQQFPRSLINPLQASSIAASLSPYPTAQGQGHQYPVTPGQSVQQLCPGLSQIPGTRRASSGILTDFRNPHLQQVFNERMPQPTNQCSNSLSSMHPQQTQIQQGGSQSGIESRAASGSVHRVQLSASMGRSQSSSVPTPISRPRLSSAIADGFISTGETNGDPGGWLLEQNWRPAGRMRGALTGQAYSAALRQFMIDTAPPSQPAGPPLSGISLSSDVSPQMPVLCRDNETIHVSRS